jgi:hypothetical protein
MEHIRTKLFSIEEANHLLPRLEQALGALAEMSREVAALHREIEVLGAIAASGASTENADLRELREKAARTEDLLGRLRDGLRGITAHGCILRDLEIGLVDFYTMAGGRVVCLCWRRGEPEIAHWHPVDQGFAGRRPLSELG